MSKYVLMLGLALFSGNVFAQDFVREIDKKTEKVLLRGKITFEDIREETTCSWFDKNANIYKPNQAAIDVLEEVAKPYRFVVFAGTWCGDTKDLLPKFYKVLKTAGIDLHSVEMYGVNRQKEALNIEHTLYNIGFVPTIIIMQQAREVGRIVETVESSIEEDLLRIIEKDAARKK